MTDSTLSTHTRKSAKNRTLRTTLLTIQVRERGALLTPRQVQVLSLLASGKSMKEAAIELKISHSTFRKHIEHALRRSKTRTRDQLMAMAGASGLYHRKPSTFGDQPSEELKSD
jgi:DNA-binding CsgD family transcriptional regulator